MPTIPPGRWTRQKIVELALNRAGNRALQLDAMDFLAQHLFELYTLAAWPFLYTTATLPLAARFPLPEDFVTPQDDHALRVSTIDGHPSGAVVVELSPELFDVQYAGNTATGAPPQYWMVERGTNEGRCFPNPAGHTVFGTLRYRRLPPEPAPAVAPSDVPVFPYPNYLVQAVYCFALEHERDPRALPEGQVRDNLLGLIRRGASPLRSQRSDIPLDPLVFGTPFRGD